MHHNKKGEIATFISIATLIGLLVFTFVASNIVTSKKETTSTKAAQSCEPAQWDEYDNAYCANGASGYDENYLCCIYVQDATQGMGDLRTVESTMPSAPDTPDFECGSGTCYPYGRDQGLCNSDYSDFTGWCRQGGVDGTCCAAKPEAPTCGNYGDGGQCVGTDCGNASMDPANGTCNGGYSCCKDRPQTDPSTGANFYQDTVADNTCVGQCEDMPCSSINMNYASGQCGSSYLYCCAAIDLTDYRQLDSSQNTCEYSCVYNSCEYNNMVSEPGNCGEGYSCCIAKATQGMGDLQTQESQNKDCEVGNCITEDGGCVGDYEANNYTCKENGIYGQCCVKKSSITQDQAVNTCVDPGLKCIPLDTYLFYGSGESIKYHEKDFTGNKKFILIPQYSCTGDNYCVIDRNQTTILDEDSGNRFGWFPESETCGEVGQKGSCIDDPNNYGVCNQPNLDLGKGSCHSGRICCVDKRIGENVTVFDKVTGFFSGLGRGLGLIPAIISSKEAIPGDECRCIKDTYLGIDDSSNGGLQEGAYCSIADKRCQVKENECKGTCIKSDTCFSTQNQFPEEGVCDAGWSCCSTAETCNCLDDGNGGFSYTGENCAGIFLNKKCIPATNQAKCNCVYNSQNEYVYQGDGCGALKGSCNPLKESTNPADKDLKNMCVAPYKCTPKLSCFTSVYTQANGWCNSSKNEICCTDEGSDVLGRIAYGTLQLSGTCSGINERTGKKATGWCFENTDPSLGITYKSTCGDDRDKIGECDMGSYSVACCDASNKDGTSVIDANGVMQATIINLPVSFMADPSVLITAGGVGLIKGAKKLTTINNIRKEITAVREGSKVVETAAEMGKVVNTSTDLARGAGNLIPAVVKDIEKEAVTAEKLIPAVKRDASTVMKEGNVVSESLPVVENGAKNVAVKTEEAVTGVLTNIENAVVETEKAVGNAVVKAETEIVSQSNGIVEVNKGLIEKAWDNVTGILGNNDGRIRLGLLGDSDGAALVKAQMKDTISAIEDAKLKALSLDTQIARKEVEIKSLEGSRIGGIEDKNIIENIDNAKRELSILENDRNTINLTANQNKLEEMKLADSTAVEVWTKAKEAGNITPEIEKAGKAAAERMRMTLADEIVAAQKEGKSSEDIAGLIAQRNNIPNERGLWDNVTSFFGKNEADGGFITKPDELKIAIGQVGDAEKARLAAIETEKAKLANLSNEVAPEVNPAKGPAEVQQPKPEPNKPGVVAEEVAPRNGKTVDEIDREIAAKKLETEKIENEITTRDKEIAVLENNNIDASGNRQLKAEAEANKSKLASEMTDLESQKKSLQPIDAPAVAEVPPARVVGPKVQAAAEDRVDKLVNANVTAKAVENEAAKVDAAKIINDAKITEAKEARRLADEAKAAIPEVKTATVRAEADLKKAEDNLAKLEAEANNAREVADANATIVARESNPLRKTIAELESSKTNDLATAAEATAEKARKAKETAKDTLAKAGTVAGATIKAENLAKAATDLETAAKATGKVLSEAQQGLSKAQKAEKEAATAVKKLDMGTFKYYANKLSGNLFFRNDPEVVTISKKTEKAVSDAKKVEATTTKAAVTDAENKLKGIKSEIDANKKELETLRANRENNIMGMNQEEVDALQAREHVLSVTEANRLNAEKIAAEADLASKRTIANKIASEATVANTQNVPITYSNLVENGGSKSVVNGVYARLTSNLGDEARGASSIENLRSSLGSKIDNIINDLPVGSAERKLLENPENKKKMIDLVMSGVEEKNDAIRMVNLAESAKIPSSHIEPLNASINKIISDLDLTGAGSNARSLVDSELQKLSKLDGIDPNIKKMLEDPGMRQSIINEIISKTEKVQEYAMGDIHADWNQFVKKTNELNPIGSDGKPGIIRVGTDGKVEWFGGKNKINLTGDIFDRGVDAERGINNSSFDTAKKIIELQESAGKAGGRVTVLLGNHDVAALTYMNYVKNKAIDPLYSLPNGTLANFIQNGMDFEDIKKGMASLDGDKVHNWLKNLPAIEVTGDGRIFMHSDGMFYLKYGNSAEEINRNISAILNSNDGSKLLNLFTEMTDGRDAFRGTQAEKNVQKYIKTLTGLDEGGVIYHGHTQGAVATNDRVKNLDMGLSEVYSPGNPNRGLIETTRAGLDMKNGSRFNIADVMHGVGGDGGKVLSVNTASLKKVDTLFESPNLFAKIGQAIIHPVDTVKSVVKGIVEAVTHPIDSATSAVKWVKENPWKAAIYGGSTIVGGTLVKQVYNWAIGQPSATNKSNSTINPATNTTTSTNKGGSTSVAGDCIGSCLPESQLVGEKYIVQNGKCPTAQGVAYICVKNAVQKSTEKPKPGSSTPGGATNKLGSPGTPVKPAAANPAGAIPAGGTGAKGVGGSSTVDNNGSGASDSAKNVSQKVSQNTGCVSPNQCMSPYSGAMNVANQYCTLNGQTFQMSYCNSRVSTVQSGITGCMIANQFIPVSCNLITYPNGTNGSYNQYGSNTQCQNGGTVVNLTCPTAGQICCSQASAMQSLTNSLTSGLSSLMNKLFNPSTSTSNYPSISSNITDTPTPTPTSTPGSLDNPNGVNVTFNLKIKFQGIVNPKLDLNKLKVMVTLVDAQATSGTKTAVQIGNFIASSSANVQSVVASGSANIQSASNSADIWTGSVTFTKVEPKQGYQLLIKGPKHVQKKICVNSPTETAAGNYSCSNLLNVIAGNNDLDLSNIYMMAGDVPKQDGEVNSIDLAAVRTRFGKLDYSSLDTADLNLDGAVNSQDFSLIMQTLQTTDGVDQK